MATIIETNIDMENFYGELVTLLNKHVGHLDAIVMLAVASKLVGSLIAYQDQRTLTPEDAMKIVFENMRLGNADAIAKIHDTKGNA